MIETSVVQVLVTRHTSHVTPHTSHVTRHTSNVTRHTSHVTRHTSHVTRHAIADPVCPRRALRNNLCQRRHVLSRCGCVLFLIFLFPRVIWCVSGSSEGTVFVWGPSAAAEASSRRFAPDPCLVLPLSVHGVFDAA